MKLTPDQRDWFRLRRSGLVEPFSSPEEAARRLIGIQAQLAPATDLSLWNRTRSCTPAELNAARLEERSVVRFWGQRNTLHLYSTDDWPLLFSAFAELESVTKRRFEQAGLGSEFRKVARRTRERLADGKQLTYKDVKSRRLQEGTDPWVASYAILMALVREGVACHGPDRGGASTFAHREQWRPDLEWSPPAAAQATSELAVQYLSAYGPAELRDLAFWCGTTVTKAKSWVESAGERCCEVVVDDRTHWCCRDDLDELAAAPPRRSAWPTRLLYRFDPLLLATKDKTWLTDTAGYKKVWTSGGHVGAVLLLAGRIAGTWRYDRKPGGLRVRLTPFAKLSRPVHRAVEKEAAAIASFLELPLESLQVANP